MGVNQHGLAIGNEAVFSKIPANKKPALLGMDLLRLALERAVTAQEGVEVITSLLEAYNQGGNCVQDGQLYYHNSFLLADPWECWVLETIGKHWAARTVTPLYTISNLLSLDKRWDLSSPGLSDFLLDEGLAKSREQIHLSGNLSDLVYTTFADGRKRCARSRQLLERHRGKISLETMAEILRDHHGKVDPTPGIFGADICMHASLGPVRTSQTTGSLIVSLQEGETTIFATGTAAPCAGIFKPVWVDAPPALGPTPTGQFDPAALFWSHEQLHREVIRNYPQRSQVYQEERLALESEFIRGALEITGCSREERQAYTESCFARAEEAENRWLAAVLQIPTDQSLLHRLAWQKFNRKAGFQSGQGRP